MTKTGIDCFTQKGKELTRSVGESITAATEMVRTSEEIKTSTVEAARTSDRNCQQVAQGYELTKDMSKASVDVRESVQETSKFSIVPLSKNCSFIFLTQLPPTPCAPGTTRCRLLGR